MARAHRTLLACLLGGALSLLYHTAVAQELNLDSGERRNTLIELYTSQGCSSCPPAERWLGNLQSDPRLWKELIPLAFHVDYWDYIGWKDELARPAFSARQRRYHREGKVSAVYTPGFVVNGEEWRPWFGIKHVPSDNGRVGSLVVSLSDETFTARWRPTEPHSGKRLLHVALLGVGLTADISRGENAGKHLPQDFVVLDYQSLPSNTDTWQGSLPRHAHKGVPRLAIAAWVTGVHSQAPLQSVGGWLPVETRPPN